MKGSSRAWTATICCVLERPDGAHWLSGGGSQGRVRTRPSIDFADCTGWSQNCAAIAPRTSPLLLSFSGRRGMVAWAAGKCPIRSRWLASPLQPLPACAASTCVLPVDVAADVHMPIPQSARLCPAWAILTSSEPALPCLLLVPAIKTLQPLQVLPQGLACGDVQNID